MSDSKSRGKNWKSKKTKQDWLERMLLAKGIDERTAKFVCGTKNNAMIVVYALILTFTFKTFFYDNFKIPSGSMNPLLLNGDRVLVNKFHYGYTRFSFPFGLMKFKGRILSHRTPQRGEIVVFKLPQEEDTDIFYIKRVIGLPGDKIQVKKGMLYVNDRPATYYEQGVLDAESATNHNAFPSMKYTEVNRNGYSYSVLVSDPRSLAGNTGAYIVPEGYYFMMGDNRDNSKDSRFADFGPIPFTHIIGRAERIFFSTANGQFNYNRIFANIQAIYNEEFDGEG